MSVSRLVLAAVLLLGAGAARAEFVSSPVTTAYVGAPYVYDVVAIGSGRVEITAPSGLPSWLTLVPTGSGTATLQGTPGPADTGAGILLRSEDTACRIFLFVCYRYQFFDITIVHNTAPRIVPPGIGDQTAVEGDAFTLEVASAFDDPDGDSLSFSAAGLPAGFSLTGSRISGTPTTTHVQGSPFEIRVTADDGRGGTIEEAFLLRVSALQRADLAVAAISAAPSPAVPGEPVTWALTIANSGPDRSGSAAVTIELAGEHFSLDAHDCTLEALESGQRVTCGVVPIDSGESATVTLTGAVAAAGDVYVAAAVAALESRPVDPVAANDSRAAALNVGEAISADAAQRVGGAALAAVGADFDADGYDDLLAATEPDAPAALHMNIENPSSLHASLTGELDERRGLSTLPLSLGEAVGSTDAAAADLDNDGDLDAVVAINGPGAAAQVFVNDGTGVMTPGETFGPIETITRAVAAADADGDGYADIVLANDEANALYVNRGGAAFEEVVLQGAAQRSVGVAVVDLDGDGRPEIVFANEDGDATWHANTGPGFAASSTLATGRTSAVAAGDFNGDGYIDLVFAREVPGPAGLPGNPVYLNDGAGSLSLAQELGASPTVDVLAADFDGDERLDIVAINASGAHQLFVNGGDGSFALHPTLFVARNAAGGAAARIGMRGSVDVVVVGGEGAALFLNDGQGRFGLGDTGRPVIHLNGEDDVTLEIEGTYADPGATAMDDVDGALVPTVDNPVDTKVIGTYTVTYTAKDSAGNAAVPVTRTVRVEARQASGGGGGGAVDAAMLAILAFAAGAVLSRRRLSPGIAGGRCGRLSRPSGLA